VSRHQAALKAPELDDAGYSDELADYTLGEIVEKFGSVRAYADVTEANGKRERARSLRLKNDVFEGRLIDRDLVEKGVLGAFDAAFRRLVTDIARTVTRRVFSYAQGGESVETAERYAAGQISDQLKRAKVAAARALKSAKPTDLLDEDPARPGMARREAGESDD
jgi:hypothetical protein